MGRRLRLGNIIFQTPILFVLSPSLKIGWWLRDAVTFHKLDIIAHTHTTHIITRTHITTLTTIPISVIGGNKWLTCQFNQPL